jgi:hypothetical protein
MESTENKFTEKESLLVIQNMIQAAKTGLTDNSFYFLFWGWLVFISSIVNYALLMIESEYAFAVWLLMPVGGVITAIYSRQRRKTRKVVTYMDEFMKHVLIAFLVSLLIVLLFGQKLGLSTYPMVLLVYGIWLYISGGSIRFVPLMAGGVINWALAIAALFVDFRMQLLLLAAAVLLGYIIPGYLLKRKYRQNV